MPDTLITETATTTTTPAAVAAPATEAAAAPPAVASASAAAPEGTAPVAAPVTEAAKAAAPVTYTLTAPEGSTLAPDFMERTVAIARERGLAPEAAQAIVDVVAQEEAARTAAITAEVEGWRAQTLADPALGRTPGERTAAIQKGVQLLDAYGRQNPEDAAALKATLNDSGLGNHPQVARFFAFLGARMSEGRIVQPNATASGEQRAVGSRMWPDLPQT